MNDIALVNRIEEQLVKKFNKEVPNAYKDIVEDIKVSKEECISLMNKWLEFWINEKPLIKIPSKVLIIKKKICDYKLQLLIQQAAEWRMLDYIDNHIIDRIRD